MAEAFVFNIAEILLGNLASTANQEISLVRGFKREVKKFENTLSVIKAVLLDAEEKQANNHELGNWLGKLKDVCYEANDVLGEFQYENLWRQVVKRGGFKKKVRNFFSHSNKPVFRFKMVHKIQDIKERLDEIDRERAKFSLTERIEDRQALHRERETHSFVQASDVIGRDEDKEKIVNKLLMRASSQENDQENVFVIPIVGIGGLGKTTLAKLVYNDADVTLKFKFKLKLWVHVSEDFDVKKLMRDIITSANRAECGDLPMDLLQSTLREIVLGKRFLLVLDDVWNVDQAKWSEIKTLLMTGASGSTVIVTTRNELAASVVGSTGFIHRLRGLSDKESVSLLERWAFGRGDKEKYPNLAKIGDEIAKKCAGVPLAVKTLGSLLFLKTVESEWKFVKDNDIWRLEQKENDILATLKVSYDALPRNLKQCFSLCSIFPKNHRFNDIELIQLWTAEGLIISDDNQELEDVGQQYVKELWSRSLLQAVEQQDFLLTFEMHHLVHELAVSVAKTDCLAIDSRTPSIHERVQHLSFLENEVPNKLETELKSVRHLQTILFPVSKVGPIGNDFVKMCISRFKYLRVLDLSDSRSEELPSSIANLKHLRYLDLSGNCHIEILPNFICNLLNLQTLRLHGCVGLKDLPRDITNLKNLRYLLLTTRQVCLSKEGIGSLISLRYLQIAKCHILEDLGEGIKRLTSLRTLIITECDNLKSLPDGLKNLTALETLAISNCYSLNLTEWEVEDVQFRIRTFVIANLPRLIALPQWLQKAEGTLQHIRIGPCDNIVTLPLWFQSLVSLQKLEIIACPKLSALPEGMNHLMALRKLKIEQCPKLSERCRNVDRPKISHVADITFVESQKIKATDD